MAPPAALAAAALLRALLPRAADAFGFNSIVAIVVGDATTAFPGAPVSIMEVREKEGVRRRRAAGPGPRVPPVPKGGRTRPASSHTPLRTSHPPH